jgi:hypothetical protein
LRRAIDGFNLLQERVSDIDCLYESRLPGKTEPVQDIRFH